MAEGREPGHRWIVELDSGTIRTASERFERKAMATLPVTVHLPVELVEKLDRKADVLERSRGGIVEEAVGGWLDREAERDRLTRQALASASAGRLIDHERVEEWLDSLGSPDPVPMPRA